MNQEMIASLVIGGATILCFVLARLVRIIWPNSRELSRKTAHLLSGLVSLSFVFVFESPLYPAILCGAFLLLLLATRAARLLQEIHDIQRNSLGAFLFPVAVFLLFLLAKGQPAFYFVSILVLSLSDTAAALVGKRYGTLRFELEGDLKSVEGTFSFTVVTFIVAQVPLLLMTDLPKLQVVLISLVVALIVTGFELISLWGTDNLFIPLGTYYIISRMAMFPIAQNWETVFWIVLALAWTMLLFGPVRQLKVSYKITIMLFNFAALALVGHGWPWPALLVELILVLGASLYIRRRGSAPFQVAYVLSMIAVPVVLMFLSAWLNDFLILFPAYIAALVLMTGMFSWELFVPERKERGMVAQALGHAGMTAAAFLVVGVGSALISPQPLFTIAATATGTFIGQAVYGSLVLGLGSSLNRAVLRNLAVLSGAAFSFVIPLVLWG